MEKKRETHGNGGSICDHTSGFKSSSENRACTTSRSIVEQLLHYLINAKPRNLSARDWKICLSSQGITKETKYLNCLKAMVILIATLPFVSTITGPPSDNQ